MPTKFGDAITADQVVFNEDLNTVHGPVKTQFGYHLLEITARSE